MEGEMRIAPWRVKDQRVSRKDLDPTIFLLGRLAASRVSALSPTIAVAHVRLKGILFACLGTALGTIGTAAAQEASRLVVRESAAPCLRLRVRPESTSPTLGCLAPGTTVLGIGVAPYWRRVRADTLEGWAAKKFLAEAGSVPPDTTTALRDDGWLEIHVVDVGQGDGMWIHTFDDNIPGNGRYEGKNIVIDGGPSSSDAGDRLYLDIKSKAHEGAIIDGLIVTHPHADHYLGAMAVLRHFEVREYYDPGYPSTALPYLAFRHAVDAESAEGRPTVQHIGRATFGTPAWGSELTVQWLWAWPGTATGLGLDTGSVINDASIVFRLVYGSQSVLFMGDAEGQERSESGDTARYVEANLLANPGPAGLASTVLKVGHHGSKTASTIPFLKAVKPRIVVVSSGRKSFSGVYLPDKVTLDHICANDPTTRIYRTDQDDAAEGRTVYTDQDGDDIVIRTNGKSTLVEASSAGRPITVTGCTP
jgi:competence protein ComEC